LDYIEKENYEVENAQVSISVPTSILIRHLSIWFYLLEALEKY